MRLSIFATPPHPTAASAPPGALEGRLLETRLGKEDVALELTRTDPGQDLAEQLERLLVERAPGPRDAVLLCAACPCLLSIDSELFLCLDPTQPLVGDALADVAAAMRDRAPGPKLLLLDLLDVKAAEPARGEALLEAVERAVDAAAGTIEVLLSVRPASREARPSPFAEALVSYLDAMEKDRGLTARSLFDRLQKRVRELVPVFHHVRARQSFELVPFSKTRTATPSVPPDRPAPVVADLGVAAFRTGEPVEPEGAPAKPVAAPKPVVDQRAKAPSVPAPEAPLPPPPAPPRLAPPTMPSLQLPESIDLSWDDDLSSPADMVAIAAPRPLAAPPGASLPPPPADGPISSPISGRGISPFVRHVVEGELLAVEGDHAGAIASYRKALAVLGPVGDPEARAEMYTRIGYLRAVKGDRDDAAADFEKALALQPGHVPALSALIELYAAAEDFRGLISAEERLLSALQENAAARFDRLMRFAVRWEESANKLLRAKQLYERAREIRPDDPALAGRLRQMAAKLSMERARQGRGQ